MISPLFGSAPHRDLFQDMQLRTIQEFADQPADVFQRGDRSPQFGMNQEPNEPEPNAHPDNLFLPDLQDENPPEARWLLQMRAQPALPQPPILNAPNQPEPAVLPDNLFLPDLVDENPPEALIQPHMPQAFVGNAESPPLNQVLPPQNLNNPPGAPVRPRALRPHEIVQAFLDNGVELFPDSPETPELIEEF